MDRLAHDVRIALRGFRRTPAFAATAVVILAIGIGMAVAMSTVFQAVLLRRLPVRDEDRLAVMWTTTTGNVEYASALSDLDQVKRHSSTIVEIAGFSHYGSSGYPLLDGDRTLTLNRTLVTGNFFDVLGARAVVGRLLRPDDDQAGASQVIVISYAAWRREFAGDTAVVGRQLIDAFSRVRITVVGIAPPGLDYPAGADYWAPRWSFPGYDAFDAVAWLAPRATVAAARAEFFDRLKRLHPEHHLVGATAQTFREAVLGDLRPILVVVMAAVVMLLTIACVNVGNLLLMRGATRTREFAIRRALGASRANIVGQLLTESALLAAAGGLLGALAAGGLVRMFVAVAPRGLPRTDTITVNGTFQWIAIGVTAVAALVFGLLPALAIARGDPGSRSQLGTRAGSETKARRQLRRSLVGGQVALAVVMLAGAGLLVRSLGRLQRLDLGYRAGHLSVLNLACDAQACPTQAKYFALAEAVAARWSAAPGVESTTPILIPPFYGDNVWAWKFSAEGMTAAQAEGEPRIPVEVGGKDFFRTMGITLLRGRGFEDGDREGAPLVVVVSQSVAHHFWPNEDPIGKHVRAAVQGSSIQGGSEWRTVVGVVNDTRFRNLREASGTIYLPWRQSIWQGLFAVRTSAGLGSVLPALRQAAREIGPTVSIWQAETMDDLLAAPLAEPRLSALLVSAFGLVSLLLAAIGLYGVMASAVRDDMREIGVRLVLGASPERIRRDVLRRALGIASVGVLAGLVCALGASRLLTSLLFEVSATDPVALVGACGLLLVVAAAAAFVPARWATRVDPAQVMRAD